MATSIQPILNGELQSDLDGAGFSAKGFAALGAIESATIYIDPAQPVEVGTRGTSLPYSDLGKALKAAQPGDKIVFRPGTYNLDETFQIKKPGLTISGYGAHLTSTLPNNGPMFLITSGNVILEGFTFDGTWDHVAGDQAQGVIRVSRAADVTLRDLTISNQVGYGIELFDGFDGIRIEKCDIEHCALGIFGIITLDNVNGVTIKNNLLGNNRNGGIYLAGDFADDFNISNVTVFGNTLVNNEPALTSFTAISLGSGIVDVMVQQNFVYGNHTAIALDHCLRGQVLGNSPRAAVTAGIALFSCQDIEVIGNILDGRTSAGNPVMGTAIKISGFYTIANDSGPFLISGNIVSGLDSPGYAVDHANTNNTMITGNTFTGVNASIHCTSVAGTQISSNRFDWSGTGAAIQIDAGTTRGWSGVTINANRFFPTGNPVSLISTVDASSTGQAGLTIINNSSPFGKTYSQGIYKPTGTVTSVIVSGNVPFATNRDATTRLLIGTNGWANDPQQILTPVTIFVPSIAVRTTGSPVDLVTIPIPAGITRWAVNSTDSAFFSESAVGTLAGATFQAWTAAGGTGQQMFASTFGPTAPSIRTIWPAQALTKASSGGNLVIRQTTNSVNAGVLSFYITLYPMP